MAGIGDEIERRVRAAMDGEIRKRMVHALTMLAEACVEDALREREYKDLTGNTTASFMAGVYDHGKLVKVVEASQVGEDVPTPTRGTIRKAEIPGAKLFYRITTGEPVYVRRETTIDTDGDFGRNKSRKFLAGYKSNAEYEVVVTTGTEYSSFLENAKSLNVLTETGYNATRGMAYNVILNNFKPI